MRKIILKLIAAFIPTLILFFTNLYFNVSVAEKASSNALSGKTSYLFGNYNDRQVVRRIIEKRETVHETIIFGSSSEKEVTSEVTGYDDQANFCLSSGYLADYIGILGLYKKLAKGFPKRIILSPRPWDFVKDGRVYYLSQGFVFKDTFAHFYDKTGGEMYGLVLEKIKGTVKENLSTTTLFAKNYAHRIYERKEDSPRPDLVSIRYPDGHMGYSEKHDKESTEAKPRRSEFSYVPESFPQKMSDYFVDIKNFCAENGIELVIFLVPVSQICVDNFDGASQGITINDCENHVRKLSEGLLVRGTYSPNPLNFTNKDFYDDKHLKREHLKQVWDYIK